MKSTIHHIALAGALCLGLAATAAVAQDRPAAPGAPQAGAPRGFGQRGPDRQKLIAEIKQRREQRLHDLLQIKPDQETAFHTFLTSMEQARPQRGQRPDGASGPNARGAEAQHLTTPERLDRLSQRMAERTAERQQRLQKTTAAVKTFYAVLTPEQRKAFDDLPLMRIGDRHHDRPWGGRMGRRFQG